jgi:anaerobic selenocysteine-containing dehydrogenase
LKQEYNSKGLKPKKNHHERGHGGLKGRYNPREKLTYTITSEITYTTKHALFADNNLPTTTV